jgi:FlaG/FlaF family flagellin (archaellin)
MRKKLTIALAGTVAALTLGSIAWAAIPAGNGVISGCYDKTTGALRVTDTATNTPKGCSNKEAALTWSQQGPKGDPGIPGPKGDKGDPGTSHVWGATGGGDITASSNYGSKVAELTVPGCIWCQGYAGDSYLFSAKLIVTAGGMNQTPEIVHCQLAILPAGGGSYYDYASGTVSSNGSGDVLVSTLSLQYAAKLNGGTASVWCDAPQTADASHVMITATQVGGIN